MVEGGWGTPGTGRHVRGEVKGGYFLVTGAAPKGGDDPRTGERWG